MTGSIDKPERETQNRVIQLFRDELGYRYIGDWRDRDNSNIEEGMLREHLTRMGYREDQVSAAIRALKLDADDSGRGLYENNQAVYKLLRFGVEVKTRAAEPTATVWLVDWENPVNNDFAIAEEVTLRGNQTRRPDIVLYLNGIAIGVLELKNSRVEVAPAIRQSISNQKREFNEWFFSTIQLVFAGSDTQGLRYGTVGTEAKYFLSWKEEEEDNSGYQLDKYLGKMCRKDRIIELMNDFVLFDGGQKKLPRVHQYFAIKAAQGFVERKQGGIIWHTQGSGKSIVMILLARWILEHNPNARVAVITDRDELDKQMLRNMRSCGILSRDHEDSFYRARSGQDLLNKLGDTLPRVISSLIHKFGKKKVDDFEAYVRGLEAGPSPTVGELFVFVDECHRTQSGRMHRLMKAILPNAVFIGFTGTPLLKDDKKTTMEVFGQYIHQYRFDEAVEDGVVLDFAYEARDVEQRLVSQDRVDDWFDASTANLNDWQRDELKKHWGTLQKLLGSKSRLQKIVGDILLDFRRRPRLAQGRGNAILVAKSIFEACRYFSLFNEASTGFRGKCAIVTSYNPQARDVTLEDIGANTETDKEFVYRTYQDLLSTIDAAPNKTRTETYEDSAKKQFIDHPAEMRLLIVVDKLLTGFDAPACTFLYIDKSMKDHGLFQAICRTNRLHEEGKEFGYIVDYMDLFKRLVNDKGTGALQVYTSKLDLEPGKGDPNILMRERLNVARQKLEDALEQVELMIEPVEPPKSDLDFMHYFCGNTEIPTELKDRESRRHALYKAIASYVRSYSNLADELDLAGFSSSEITRLKSRANYFVNLRDVIRNAAGETLDLKQYEADMRYLIDNYVHADEPRTVSEFEDMGILEVIARSGMDSVERDLSNRLGGDQNAVAETIENNVRSRIITDRPTNAAYFDRMSRLLDEVIRLRREQAINYREYLARLNEIARRVESGGVGEAHVSLNTRGKMAVFNALESVFNNEQAASSADESVVEIEAPYESSSDSLVQLAIRIHDRVFEVRPHGWKGVQAKEAIVFNAICELLDNDDDRAEEVFQVLLAQEEYS